MSCVHAFGCVWGHVSTPTPCTAGPRTLGHCFLVSACCPALCCEVAQFFLIFVRPGPSCQASSILMHAVLGFVVSDASSTAGAKEDAPSPRQSCSDCAQIRIRPEGPPVRARAAWLAIVDPSTFQTARIATTAMTSFAPTTAAANTTLLKNSI